MSNRSQGASRCAPGCGHPHDAEAFERMYSGLGNKARNILWNEGYHTREQIAGATDMALRRCVGLGPVTLYEIRKWLGKPPDRDDICGVLSSCGPNGETLACGYAPHGDDRPHAWAFLEDGGTSGPDVEALRDDLRAVLGEVALLHNELERCEKIVLKWELRVSQLERSLAALIVEDVS